MADPAADFGVTTGTTRAKGPAADFGVTTQATVTKRKKKDGGGLLGKVARYTGLEFQANLAKDIGHTAVGVVPGLIEVGKAGVHDLDANLHGHPTGIAQGGGDLGKIGKQVAEGYKDYYGHDVLHHLYTRPVQPILDAATVLTGGAGAAAKAGLISAERATIVTRSPRNIATGKGPVHKDITSDAPLVKAREVLAGKARTARPEGGVGRGKHKIVGVGGEVKKYGKQIQAEATQAALGRMVAHEPYAKATRRLKPDEWTALHIRAMDIHPDDLAEIWKGTPNERDLTPNAVALSLAPSKRMLAAEPEARALSDRGGELYKEKGKLTEETAEARPDLTKRQASELLGRPVKSITGKPYYLPHTTGPAPSVSPLAASGGGKGVPRAPGSTKQNTGALALGGKLHLRGDVLGPEFLRRVKYVKYDETHNALVRGSVRMSRQELDALNGGQLPKSWEYVRTKPQTFTRTVSAEPDPNQLLIPGAPAATKTEKVTVGGRSVPPTMRVESETHTPIKDLIPNAEDLHDSQLAKDGFSTTDRAQAHTSNGRYYIVPKSTVKAATGEFTRSNDFTRYFVKRPLTVWRAVVLGLRVGFLTNNLVGNSIMYAAKTGGNGALRDLFGAILETHGPQVAKKALDNAATPPKLRADLYKEFFPEQVRGTFGRTQTPATSPGHVAAGKAIEVGRTVTGAIPKLTSKVAEEIPRRALIRHYIRNSPEFKKVYSALPKETRSFEVAARHLLEGKGGKEYQRYVSRRVNQALGDYLGLSATERNVIRNTIPFYAWYKAITTTTFHLAADTPLRANVLGQIGRIGRDASDEWLGEVPTFLEGAVGLGEGEGGTKKVLATGGLNPYSTLEQLRRGALENVNDIGLNPFLIAGAEAYAKARYSDDKSPGAIGSSALTAIVRNLPPSRLIKPLPPSKLYPNRNRKSELLSFLGAPIKDYDVSEARKQARKGR